MAFSTETMTITVSREALDVGLHHGLNVVHGVQHTLVRLSGGPDMNFAILVAVLQKAENINRLSSVVTLGMPAVVLVDPR
jgi:hypothetical protein